MTTQAERIDMAAHLRGVSMGSHKTSNPTTEWIRKFDREQSRYHWLNARTGATLDTNPFHFASPQESSGWIQRRRPCRTTFRRQPRHVSHRVRRRLSRLVASKTMQSIISTWLRDSSNQISPSKRPSPSRRLHCPVPFSL